jgi:ATP-dependent helicase HepA
LAVIKEVQDEIPILVQHAQKIAEARQHELLDQARRQLDHTLNQEIDRLLSLQRVNPLIRDEEIEVLRQRLLDSQQYIERAGLEVQGLRMIVCA